MATLTPSKPAHKLQIFSGEARSQYDFFRLEDGRLVQISQGTEIDAERNSYAVAIIERGFSSWHYDEAHRQMDGFAGFLYENRNNGSWTLDPRERITISESRGAHEPFGIKSDEKATRRQAAIELINQSDELTRYWTIWQHGPHTRKAGDWQINPLPRYADSRVRLNREPYSINLQYERTAYFEAWHPKHGAIRLIAERQGIYPTGCRLNVRVIPAPNLADYTGKIQQVPARLERWIESRIYSV